jgi:hypothetical protein
VSRGLDETVQKLRASYAARLQEKLGPLDGALRDLIRTGSSDSVERVWQLSDLVAGSAETHGFGELGQVVREMQKMVEPFRGGDAPPDVVREGLVLMMREARRHAS